MKSIHRCSPNLHDPVPLNKLDRNLELEPPPMPSIADGDAATHCSGVRSPGRAAWKSDACGALYFAG